MSHFGISFLGPDPEEQMESLLRSRDAEDLEEIHDSLLGYLKSASLSAPEKICIFKAAKFVTQASLGYEFFHPSGNSIKASHAHWERYRECLGKVLKVVQHNPTLLGIDVQTMSQREIRALFKNWLHVCQEILQIKPLTSYEIAHAEQLANFFRIASAMTRNGGVDYPFLGFK